MLEINHKKLCENCFAQIEKEPCPKCGFDQSRYVKDPMTLALGSVLENRYVIGGVIGKGGFGTTYLAYDRKLECRVAVKEYYPYGLAVRTPGTTTVSVSGAEAKETFTNGAEKFYDEARLVAQFNGNPNIVSVHDFFYANDTVYFTMGYLDGMTLKSYLKEYGALSLAQAVYVAESVSNALMAAHSMNVLHRDISPDNIMVCKDGTVKLLDFGAARQVVTEGSQSLSVILKQGFAPLEQYQKKGKQGPWTDIYSLGATLYHALTLDILDDPMSRLEDDEEYSSNCHQIDEGFWQIIKKATALRIVDRYQDIFEMRKELNSLHVKPEMLVEPKAAADMTGQGPTAKAFGSTARGQEEAAVGVTMPLWEEDAVGVTMPLREEDTVGVTMPLQEEATVGVTMPLREEDVVKEVRFQQEDKKEESVSLQAEDVGVTVPLHEEKPIGEAVQIQEETAEKAAMSEQKKEHKITWKEIVEMLSMPIMHLAIILVLYLILWEHENWGYYGYMNYYGGKYGARTAGIVTASMTAIGGVILFALEMFLLHPDMTVKKSELTIKKRWMLVGIMTAINAVMAIVVLGELLTGIYIQEIRVGIGVVCVIGILIVSVIGGVIAFALDTFLVQPMELKAISSKSGKVMRVVVMAVISILIAVMVLWCWWWFYTLFLSVMPSKYMVNLLTGLTVAIVFLGIWGEGSMLFILDRASVQRSLGKKEEKYQHGIRQASVLLYFAFAQRLVWSLYREVLYVTSYVTIMGSDELIVFFIIEIAVSTMIFWIYLKKSRVCAVLVSLWAIYEICQIISQDISCNLYVFVFAILAFAVTYMTFRYHGNKKE